MCRQTIKDKKQYMKEVSSGLLCPAEQKKIFLHELELNIEEYIQTCPDCTKEDLHHNFGTPDAIVRSFCENISSEQIAKRLRIKKMILIVLVIALLVWCCFACISLIDVHNEAYGTIAEGFLCIPFIWGKSV